MDSSFIISVLSVLTTILISFQIYNVINFNYEQRKFNKEKSVLSKKIEKAEKKVQDLNSLLQPLLFSEAVLIISNLKEVKDFSKHVKKIHKNKRKVVFMQTDTDDQFIQQVDVYEDTEQYLTIFNRYQINMLNQNITKLNILSNKFDINVLN